MSAAATVAVAFLLGGCRCESAPSAALDSPPDAARDAGLARARLSLSSASHDFGRADEGDRLVHVFRAENRGDAPLRLEAVKPAFGCVPDAWTRAEVAPGSFSELRVQCDTEQRAGALDVELSLTSNDPARPAQKLRLRAQVEPRLAFDALVVGLSTDYGVPTTREVRLRGTAARDAKLERVVFEKEDAARPSVEILPADATRPMGLRFKLDGRRVAEGAGGVRVQTGVSGRDPLSLSFTYRVRGFIEVVPSRPYVNLRIPNQKVSVLIASRRAEFDVNRVEVVDGPFRAELGARHPERGRYVLLSATTENLSPDRRGALGRLVIHSNDPAEPVKEVPLFALGAHAERDAPALPR